MNYHQLYVLGFAFTPDGRVALISKKRPAWQNGKLNGIGGKVEDGESSGQAMSREFKEETGVLIPEKDWIYRGRLHSHDWSVFVYSVCDLKVQHVESETDETVSLHEIDTAREFAIENVPALIELCRLQPEPPSNVIPRFDLNYAWNVL